MATVQAWIPQAISIAAMAFQIISFQFKKNKTYLILQGTGGYASALINLIGVFKSFTFASPNNKKLFRRNYMYLFIALYIVATVGITIVTKQFDWLSYVILFAQITGTVAIWTDSARIIRIAQLSIISPAWLLNNSIHFSIGGILCHIFMVVSIIISVVRYGWDGLDKK